MSAEPILRWPIVSESSIRERAPAGNAWTWTTFAAAPDLGNVRFAEWSPDGHCLAATTRGMFFWDGNGWRAVAHTFDALDVRFVRFVGLGRWVVGARDVWLCAFGELSLLWTHEELSFDHFDGGIDDVALASGRGRSGKQVFCAHVDGRWRDALVLRDLARVAGISRVDDGEWLVTGETHDGESFAALVEPVMQRMRRIPTPSVTAFIASAGAPMLGVGCAVGFGGVLLCDRVAAAVETIPQSTAVAVDPTGRVLVAGPGRISLRHAAPDPSWETVWEDASERRPIVALAVTPHTIHTLASDASVLEGRRLPDLGDDDDDEVTKREAAR